MFYVMLLQIFAICLKSSMLPPMYIFICTCSGGIIYGTARKKQTNMVPHNAKNKHAYHILPINNFGYSQSGLERSVVKRSLYIWIACKKKSNINKCEVTETQFQSTLTVCFLIVLSHFMKRLLSNLANMFIDVYISFSNLICYRLMWKYITHVGTR